jgi:hypothetical protein
VTQRRERERKRERLTNLEFQSVNNVGKIRIQPCFDSLLHRRKAESRRPRNRTVHWDRHVNLLLILVLLDRVRCTWRSNTLLVNAM